MENGGSKLNRRDHQSRLDISQFNILAYSPSNYEVLTLIILN